MFLPNMSSLMINKKNKQQQTPQTNNFFTASYWHLLVNTMTCNPEGVSNTHHLHFDFCQKVAEKVCKTKKKLGKQQARAHLLTEIF